MSALEMSRTERRQRNSASVSALRDFLQEIAANPSKFISDLSLRAALSSQGALAGYARTSTPILGMSLNHQKELAEELFGNYAILNSLRKSAIEAIASEEMRSKRSNNQDKAGLRSKVLDLEAQLKILNEDLWLVQRAYDLRCRQARSYAADATDATQALCQKEQREIDATFSLRRHHISKNNVTDFRGNSNGNS